MNFPEFRSLPLVWISLFLEILLLSLFKPIVQNFEIVSWIAVFLHAVLVLLILAKIPLRIKLIFMGAFLARLMFLFWDIYAQHIFILPNSGADTEFYYAWAVRVSENISYLNEKIRGGVYSKILGIVFYFTGPMRLLGQYLNVLLGLWVVITIFKILQILEINDRTVKIILFIAAFFPNSLIMSAIMLREIAPAFLVIWSFYFFIKWYKWSYKKHIILSLFLLGLASVFHSGVIGIFIGYSFMFLFYRNDIKSYRFTVRTVVNFLILTVVVYLATVQFSDSLLGKFSKAEDMSDIYNTANISRGESAYLTSLTISNPVQFAIFGPVRAFFFLTAPLPMNWRGFIDVFSFLFDSLFYLWVIYYFLRNRKLFSLYKPLLTGIIIMMLSVSLIFGIGVNNAGTAIRHRQKVLPIVVVMSAIMIDEKCRNKYDLDNERDLPG